MQQLLQALRSVKFVATISGTKLHQVVEELLFYLAPSFTY